MKLDMTEFKVASKCVAVHSDWERTMNCYEIQKYDEFWSLNVTKEQMIDLLDLLL